VRTLPILLLLCLTGLSAQEAPVNWAVAHQRAFWLDAEGTLSLLPEGLEFARLEKKPENAKPLLLHWDDIQQILLAERRLEIVTYRDIVWQFGRDRVLRFKLSAENASFAGTEPTLRANLGERLVAALGADPLVAERSEIRWRIQAKRTGLFRGTEGELIFTGDALLFDASQPGESRQWPIATIATVAQTGALSLAVTVPERALSDQGGHRSFLFQLKQPLEAERYRELWRRIERAHGTRLRFEGIQ
jgi:hypothetical protein